MTTKVLKTTSHLSTGRDPKMTKALSNSNYIIRRIGTHKTQCVHKMQLRPYVPHNAIDDIQVKQKELYLDTEAIRDTDSFDEKLPPLPNNESDTEVEKPRDRINPGNTSPFFSDIYVPKVVTRRPVIRRDTPMGKQKQTMARSRHPPMEIDGPTDERVSYTPVPRIHGTKARDRSADSQVNNTCNKPRKDEKQIHRQKPTN